MFLHVIRFVQWRTKGQCPLNGMTETKKVKRSSNLLREQLGNYLAFEKLISKSNLHNYKKNELISTHVPPKNIQIFVTNFIDAVFDERNEFTLCFAPYPPIGF